MKYCFAFILLVTAACSNPDEGARKDQEDSSKKCIDYKKTFRPLSNINRFFVLYYVVTPHLNSIELESTFVEALKEFGVVYTDPELTDEQRKDSYFGSANMILLVSNISETGENARIFPVIEASLKVTEGLSF